MRILIVEDEKDILETLADYLNGQDHVVREASNAVDALKKCSFEQFDVVITDWSIPGFDGSTLTKLLLKINPRLTVILTSAYEEQNVKWQEVGARGFLQKPFSMAQMERSIQALQGSFEKVS